MTSPEWSSLLDLYQQTVCVGVVQYLEKQTGARRKRGIYSAAVVLWLMMLQRLEGRGTLASAVQMLLEGAAEPLLSPCRRVRRKRISCRTGGYCQARQKLPKLLCRQVSQELVERLRVVLNPAGAGGPANVFVLDGSSLELEHSRSLVELYPPAQNQHGQSHWPVMRIVMLHDAETGLAQQPCWGPMFGPRAVSEQELAEQAMDSLPAQSVVVGDRNFGIFSIAYAAQQRGLRVLLRLTEVRARKLAGGAVSQPGERRLSWHASRWDSGKQRLLPPGSSIGGPVGCGPSRPRQVQTMAAPVHHPGLARRGDPAALRSPLEHRNRPALAKTNRKTASHQRPESRHGGKGNPASRLGLQSRARSHVHGSPPQSHRPAPTQLHSSADCG
jgi:hypothetical protein